MTGNKLNLISTGAAYIRVSSDKQDTERQLERLKFFQRQHGAQIADRHWFEDHGWARDMDRQRPAFNRLLDAVRRGEVQWIVVDSLDRFGTKSAKRLMGYLADLEDAGCRLFDASGKEWTGDDAGTEIQAWLGGMTSTREQQVKAERSVSSMYLRARAGEWQGGPPRLGFDVACFDRKTDKELWRVVWEGREVVETNQNKRNRVGEPTKVYRVFRRKVYPDGREERLDGKVTSFRTSKETEVLRIVPTRDKTKLDAAKGVFARYATESVSLAALAAWLNNLGIRNSFGKTFQSNDVRRMLCDQAYLGYVTFGKHRAGRFKRFDAQAGVIDLEPELKGKDTVSDPEDVVVSTRPDGSRWFDPIIDRPTWEAVERKFKARGKKKYAPKNRFMYLAGLLECGNCGLLMTARAQGQEYHCTKWDRYRKAGQLDECPCGRHGVKQALVEEYLKRYLKEAGTRLELLAQGPGTHHPTGRLEEQHETAWQSYCEGLGRLVDYLAENHPEEYAALVESDKVRRAADEASIEANKKRRRLPRGTLDKKYGKEGAAAAEKGAEGKVPLSPHGFVADLLHAYRAKFDAAALDAEIKALDEQHTQLTRRYADLPTPLSKKKAEADLRGLEARIEELGKQKGDVSEVVLAQYRAVQDLAQAITAAQTAMDSDTSELAYGRRAEALRGILCRIRCEFVVSPTRQVVTVKKGTNKGATRARGGPGQGRSKLVAIHFLPVVGDAKMLAVDDPQAGNARYCYLGWA